MQLQVVVPESEPVERFLFWPLQIPAASFIGLGASPMQHVFLVVPTEHAVVVIVTGFTVL